MHPEIAQHLMTTAQDGKLGEHQLQAMADLIIGMEDHRAVGQADQARREPLAVDPALHRAQAARIEALVQQMEFGFAHSALQAQQQAVIIEARVVEAIVIGDQSTEDGGQIQHMIPVLIVAGQSGTS